MSKKNTTTAPAKSPVDIAVDILADNTASAEARIYAQYIVNKHSNPSLSAFDICEELNEQSKTTAISTIVKGNTIDWYAFLLGVSYPVLDLSNTTDPETTTKELKVSDFLCIKANKKSNKIQMDGLLSSLLDMFGGNICTEYHSARSADSGLSLLWLSKYTTDLDGFKAENPHSIGSMEKQLQTICNTLFTAELAPVIRKSHVRHLSDRFNVATRYNAEKGTGYRNGNAIALLQEVVYHARDAKNGVKVYGVAGRLECQREDKPTAKK